MNDKLEQTPNGLESPFLSAELPAAERSVEASAFSSRVLNESPFLHGFAEDFLHPAVSEEALLDDEHEELEGFLSTEDETPNELEGEEQLEAKKGWEVPEKEQLIPQADQGEQESLDDEGALREDETELEFPEDLGESYDYVHEHEPDPGEYLAEIKETEDLESGEEVDRLSEGPAEEESESDEEESVEAELETLKRAKKSSLHGVLTTDIFMHVYFNKLSAGYTGQQFFDWIVDQSPGETGPNRFQLAGVEINLISNSSTAVSDFKGSLKAAGSVVVYFGHTVLGKKTTLGLAPKDPPEKKPGITCAELTNLLNAAKAKIVVLAGCATSHCVTKIKGDSVVIVTQSGKDRVTNTLQWAPAIEALLDELLASGTVGDALAAANKSFASSTDRFRMINGDPTLKMI